MPSSNFVMELDKLVHNSATMTRSLVTLMTRSLMVLVSLMTREMQEAHIVEA